MLDGQYRVVGTTDATSKTATRIQDSEGRVTLSTDTGGNATVTGYDTGNRVAYAKAADGGFTRRYYDTDGNLTRIVDPVGNKTGYAYDKANRLTVTTDPAGETVTNTYDDAGRLATRTDRLGRVSVYGYDNAGRLTSEVWKIGGTTVDTLAFTYTDDGQVKTAGNGLGKYTFGYDDLGRRDTQASTYVGGVTLTSGYSAAGDRTSVSDGAVTVGRTFDAGGRMTSAWLDLTGGGKWDGVKVEYGYTDRGERKLAERFAVAGGVGTLIGDTKLAYDDAGRVQSILHRDDAGAGLAGWSYAYDAAGNVLSETPLAGPARAFTHDTTNQVTSDTQGSAAFTYDRNGNRTMAGYATGVANRITTDGTWTYSYDDEGNLVAKAKTGESWTYEYDHRNQMTEAEKTVGTTVTTYGYKYDVYGNLVEKELNGSPLRGYAYEITDDRPGFTKSVHSVWSEYNSAGGLAARFLTNGEETVARVDVNTGDVQWLLPDRLGSTRVVTDDAGAVVSEVEYNTFGGIASQSGTDADTGDWLWTGGLLDRDTELVNLHWRWLATHNGQWTSEDPIGFSAGDMNTRRYVGNNATNGVDRNGLEGTKGGWWQRGATADEDGFFCRWLFGPFVCKLRVAGRPTRLPGQIWAIYQVSMFESFGGPSFVGKCVHTKPELLPKPKYVDVNRPSYSWGPVLFGHGTWYSNDGHITVPKGTSLTVFCPSGKGIVNSLGQRVDRREPSVLLESYHTFLPGDRVENLTLEPCDYICGGKPILSLNSPKSLDEILNPWRLVEIGTVIQVRKPTKLADLLKPSMGNVWWAACRFIKPTPIPER